MKAFVRSSTRSLRSGELLRRSLRIFPGETVVPGASPRAGRITQALALLLAVGALFPMAPAGAQTNQFPFENPFPPNSQFGQQRQSEPLGVEVDLGVDRDTDTIGVYNAGVTGDSTRYFNELGSAVSDAFGLKRSKTDVNVTDEYDEPITPAFDSSATSEFDVAVSVDGRLATRQGDDLNFKLDTTALRRVANTWGFNGVELYVCSPIPLEDKSSRLADSEEGDCLAWQLTGATASALAIDVTVKPEVSDYWNLMGVLALIMVGLTIISAIAIRLLRRGFLATLGAGNLITIGALILVSLTSWGIAAIVLAVIGRPIDDLIMGEDLGTGAHIVAVVLPALLFALPALGAALVLTRARPPQPKVAAALPGQPPAPAAPAGPPGAPSWLDQTPAPAPTAPQQAPAQPQPQQQPPDENGGEVPPSWHAPS